MAQQTPSPEYLRARAGALRQVWERTADKSSGYAREIRAAIDDLERRAEQLDDSDHRRAKLAN